MREAFKVSIVLLVVVVLIAACSASLGNQFRIGSYGTIRRLPWLHVDGQWIVDEGDNRVQLRGAGGDYYAYGRIDTSLLQYIDWMKQTGCNVIRLAFLPPNPEGKWQQGRQTEYAPAKMDYVLDLLEQNGLYAVLDCHRYWATPEVQGWTDILPTYKQDWINAWVDIANRYRDRSVIAMYELVNEPYGSGGEELRDVYYECIDAIRATGDNHIICLSAPERTWIFEADGFPWREVTWGDPSQIPPNTCLNIHSWYRYSPSGEYPYGNWFPNHNVTAEEQQIVAEMVASEWLATATYYRQKLGCPIVLGEFGTYNYGDMNHPNIRALQLEIQMAEQFGIPWWTWMLCEWIQYAPTFWTDFVNQKLGGPFTSPYLPSEIPTHQGFDLHTFPALPFNIWTRINETQSTPDIRKPGSSRWGVCMIAVTQSVPFPVVFFGPCRLRVQVWGNNTLPYWGTIIKDYYIDLAEGETWTIGSTANPVEDYAVVYAFDIANQQ